MQSIACTMSAHGKAHMNTNTNAIREHIASRIAMLDDTQHAVVFKFVQTYGEKFMKNNNGVFIDMSMFEHKELVELLDKIDSIIDTSYFESEEVDFASVDEGNDSVCDVPTTSAHLPDDVYGDKSLSPFADGAVDGLAGTEESTVIANKFEAMSANLAKKSVNNKFSLIKKKYNKQTSNEFGMRRTDDTHLSELCEEEYIIRV